MNNFLGSENVTQKKKRKKKQQSAAFKTVPPNLKSFSADGVTLPPPPTPSIPPPSSIDDRSVQSTSHFVDPSSDGLIVKVSDVESCYMCVTCAARFTCQFDGVRHVNKTKHWERKMSKCLAFVGFYARLDICCGSFQNGKFFYNWFE